MKQYYKKEEQTLEQVHSFR